MEHSSCGTGSSASDVETTVARRIAPTPAMLERVAKVRADLVARVTEAARHRQSPLVRALVAGSAARGTFLTDRLDIDLFLLFPPDLPRDRLREEGLGLGRDVLSDPQTRYAEHPYLRGTFEGFTVDAVPGFAIEDPAHPLSPVDRTPFHQTYLAARETPALVEQVRLAKQFLRSLGIYGSESRTEGFSGYLTELLVLRFGSFRGLLEVARDWRVPARLEPAEREPPRLPADVALVLADPVDPHRNVASALSRRNLGILILAARAYLTAPSERWFAPRERRPMARAEGLKRLADRGTHGVAVGIPRPDLVDDTLYPQVRKAERAVSDALEPAGFTPIGSSIGVGPERVLILVEVGHRERPGVRPQDGPPAGIDRVGDFLEKWSAPGAPVLQGPYVRADGSLAVETRQTERGVVPVLAALLPRLSIGRDLAAAVQQATVRPLEDEPDSPELGEALRALLDRRLPWA